MCYISRKMLRSTNYPCRQLNSEKIKGATLCYLSPLIVNKCSIVSAKCVCNVSDGLQRAWDEVCKTRDACDKALQGLYSLWTFLKQDVSRILLTLRVKNNWFFFPFFTGVKSVAFFFSAISTQGPMKTSNKKGRNEENNEDNGGVSDNDSITPSRVSGTSSQTWITNHQSITNKKLRPAVSDWDCDDNPKWCTNKSHNSPSGSIGMWCRCNC